MKYWRVTHVALIKELKVQRPRFFCGQNWLHCGIFKNRRRNRETSVLFFWTFSIELCNYKTIRVIFA